MKQYKTTTSPKIASESSPGFFKRFLNAGKEALTAVKDAITKPKSLDDIIAYNERVRAAAVSSLLSGRNMGGKTRRSLERSLGRVSTEQKHLPMESTTTPLIRAQRKVTGAGIKQLGKWYRRLSNTRPRAIALLRTLEAKGPKFKSQAERVNHGIRYIDAQLSLLKNELQFRSVGNPA